MPTPYFIADAAQVTVLRSLASTAFGRYDLKPPEGVDVEEIYPPSAPGNEAAYVSSLDPKQRVGGMFRRFVRADVTVQAPDGEETLATSNVEKVLDEVADRTSGDFFLESDISQAGLGPWVPFTDFNVGDLVNVEIWGRVVRLPVVRINPKDWSVHVGGQLLSDADARLAQNTDIYNAVVNDRRELAGLDVKIQTETKNRKSAIASESRRSDAYADSVVSGVESRLSRDFEASYERYSKALTDLGDTWRQELQDGLSAEQKARVEALRQEQLAREKAGTDLRGQLEKALDDAVAGEAAARRSAINAETSAREKAISDESSARKAALAAEEQARSLAVSNEARARQKAISDLSTSFTTELQTYGELVKEAKNYVDPATQQVVNFWSKENQNNFNKAVQLTLSAQAAYNDVNNIKWVSNDAWQAQQEKINEARDKFEAQQLQINAQNEEFKRLTRQLDAQQTEQIEQLTAVQQQMAEESQGQIRELMATPADSSDPNIRPTSRSDGKEGWQVKLTDMVRGSLFHIQWYNSTGTTKLGGSIVEPNHQVVDTLPTNARSYTLLCDSTDEYIYVRWVQQSKRQVSVDKSAGGWDLSRSSWEYVMSYPAPSKTASQVALRLKVTWAAATYDDTYGIRIRAGDRTLKTFTTSHLGPVTVFGDGEQWMSMTVSDRSIQPGETIKVDVYSTATFSGGRRVKRVELTGTWIEDV